MTRRTPYCALHNRLLVKSAAVFDASFFTNVGEVSMEQCNECAKLFGMGTGAFLMIRAHR